MTTQFKSFLKFAANAAVIILIVGFIVPGLYRAVKKVPPSSAAIVTQLQAINVLNGIPTLEFDDTLPSPTETCDPDGPNPIPSTPNLCYSNVETTWGVFYFDNGVQADIYEIAGSVEYCAAAGGSVCADLGYTPSNRQVLLLGVTNNSISVTPNPKEDTVAIISTNFIGVSGAAVAGVYQVGCDGDCVSIAGNGVDKVELKDTDITDFGLNGRDFTVNWTPHGSVPAGYTETRIFIVPMQTSLTAGNVLTNGCGSSACTPRGMFNYYAQNSYQLPEFFQEDSEGTAWNEGTNYKACVFTMATVNALDCSPADGMVSDDSVSDIQGSFIMHMSVFNYINGGKLTVYAAVDDDQTSATDFMAGTNSASVQMIYGTVGNVTTVAAGTNVAGKLWKFETATPYTDTTLYYYLKAKDKNGNVRYFTTNPSLDMDPNTTDQGAAGAAIMVTPIAAGSNTVSGSITNMSTSAVIENAFVFLGGLGMPGVLTDGSGDYTLINVPNGTFDVTAGGVGYCEQMRFEAIFANASDIDIGLNPGNCTFQGDGEGGAMENLHKVFSSPPEGDNFASVTESIRIGFNQPLNAGTVNDANAADVGSNIYLTTNGSDRIAGTVTYCSSSSSPGCSSLPVMDQNVVLFDQTSDLTIETFYTLIFTGAVTSDSGQSMEGNRPGGGLELRFKTGGAGFANFQTDIGANFGSGGAYMPPFVESVIPGPGMSARPNTKILIRYNEPMDSTTITNCVKLYNSSGTVITQAPLSPVLDNTERRIVTVTPDSSLSSGEYEVRVLGSCANVQGVPMRDTTQYGDAGAFSSKFTVSGSTDITPPTIYPMHADGSTGVAVNEGFIEFGFSEQLNPSTITNSTVTLKRGSNAVSASVNYDPGRNSVFVTPDNVLAPNTTYTTTFGTTVADLAGVTLASAQSFSFTTESTLDTVAPRVREARCDDYTCVIFFTEAMNNNAPTGSTYANSVINPANYTLKYGAAGTAVESMSTVNISMKAITYNAMEFAAELKGASGLTHGVDYYIEISTNVKDLSGVAIDSNNRTWRGVAEDSSETYGCFGDCGGMFGPPQADMMMAGAGAGVGFGGGGGGEGGFTFDAGPGGMMDMSSMGGFGKFTPEQAMFGNALNAYPFNPMAGMDSNVFQISIPVSALGLTTGLQDNDLFIFTFPKGTGLTNAQTDTFSPFYTDFNQWEPGIITFDTTFDTDGVQVDTAAKTVAVRLDVDTSGGIPTANDFVTIDLRGITNPAIPRDPSMGGYTLGVKLVRAGTVLANEDSTPYYIEAGGTNTITVKIYAGTQGTGTAGADGPLFMFAGGPAGPMDKNLTLTDGRITAANGTVIAGDAGVVYSSLRDGCYHIGTQPMVTLGGLDYFGQDFPEPVCVNSGQSVTKNIVLAAAFGGGTASVPVTVKLVKAGGFNGADIDIFAGGPGRFVSKTIEDVETPLLNGYTIYLPKNGMWSLGVGPAMSKSSSGGPPDMETFGGMPPAPTELKVSGLPDSGSVSLGFNIPPGVTWDDSTDTLTYAIKTSSISVPITVTDGSTGMANVDVFMHQSGGFGTGAFGRTNSSGQVTLRIADYGPYEIGAHKPGLGETFQNIDVRDESGTKLYFKGALVTTVPLKIKKKDYYISGKLLDSSGNIIGNAPLEADDGSGAKIFGGTATDGTYTMYVSAGTWTLRAMLPPSKTDTCDTFTKEVVISASTGSKSNQNIEPTSGTCYTITGTLTVDGTAQANKHIFAEQWDSANNRPSGGFFRGTNTNSAGAYNLKLPAGTYRIGTWDPEFGEIASTTVVSANATVDINPGTLETITFAFTGGTSGMNGFIELKNASDKTMRFGKPFSGADQNVTMSVQSGTYSYFVDIFGVGKFNGTVASGNTATVSVTGTTLVTLEGAAYDSLGNALPRAKITVDDFINGVHRDVTTGDDGTYSLQVKTGTYAVGINRAEYVAGQAPAMVALTANTEDYDFGGDAPDQLGMTSASKTITGTLYQSDGTTPVSDAHIWAKESATGQVVSTQLRDSTDGTYTLPVTSGIWTVKTVAPLHAETELGTTVNTIDVIADTGKNITLTEDATKIPKSTKDSFTAASSITFDDTGNSDMKLVAAGGTMAASGTVSLEMEKSYAAPEDASYTALDNVSYDLIVTASGNAVKTFPGGSADLMLEYDPTNLPAGVTEGDLNVVYYDPSADAYIPCEGGVAIDQENNTATCRTAHATTFAIVYPIPASSPSAPSGSSQSSTIGTAASVAVVDTVNTVSNTTLATTAPNTIRVTVYNQANFIQPIELDERMTKANKKADTRTAALTGSSGSIILMPNADATISMEIPASATVTGNYAWDGVINPPLVESLAVIQEGGDYEVVGARRTLSQSEVQTVVSAGSAGSTLTFSSPVTVKVPVNLKNGSIVEVYTSEDGALWESVDSAAVYIVENGQVTFAVSHLSYFAIVPTGESVMPAAEGDLHAAPTEIPVVEIPFVDVKGHWSHEYVSKLYGLNIISGKTSRRFVPDASISRAELAKIAVLAFGYDVPNAVTANPFRDVAVTAWYAPYIKVAKDNGIIAGYSSGHFKPNANVNRAEALKILLEAAKADIPVAATVSFKDVSRNAWYFKYVEYAKVNDITGGYAGRLFRPGISITRAEAAKMVIKIMEMQ